MGKKAKILLFIMVVGVLLAACSKQGVEINGGKKNEQTKNFNPAGYPIVNQPISLKMMGIKQPIEAPWDHMEFFKEMEKKTNIHFEFDTPQESNIQEKT